MTPPPSGPNPSGNLPDNPIKILQLINAGTLDGKNVPKPIRVQCVDALIGKGHSNIEIAAIFGVCDRTIRRDIEDLWKQHSAEPTPEFVEMMVGMLLHQAYQILAELRRIASDRSVQAGVRQLAIRDQWFILDGLFNRLQKLGYLPEAAQRISASISANLQEPRPLEELASELDALQDVVDSGAVDKSVASALDIAARSIAAAALGEARQQEPEDVEEERKEEDS